MEASMAQDEVRPFLAAQRHDVLRQLVADRNQAIHRLAIETVGRALNPDKPKIDGKGGALDGTIAVVSDSAAFGPVGPPFCFAYPGPKIEHPKGKEGKEGKEGKDSKEGKEGKESKDSKEGKEGKESKDSKEGKEGKEGKDSKEGKEGKESKDGKEDKDSSDGFKTGGAEVQDPFFRFGDPERLPWTTFNIIARAHPAQLENAVARGEVVF
jgi:hypothetical protein